jgi:hypothetical protein
MQGATLAKQALLSQAPRVKCICKPLGARVPQMSSSLCLTVSLHHTGSVTLRGEP